MKLYVLDDSAIPNSPIAAPQSIRVEYWSDSGWKKLDSQQPTGKLSGHKPLTLTFSPIETRKLRATLTHSTGSFSGLTELEAWRDAVLPLPSLPQPEGNLAYNDGSREFPKATASYHDRFGGVPKSAIDGITNFIPTPTNRWTSYESPNEVDWLQIDFGKTVQFKRVDLAIYDDRGGVQRPIEYNLEVWRDERWQPVEQVTKSPQEPAGSQWNLAKFPPTKTNKLRILFTNRGRAKSGVTEVMVWDAASSQTSTK